MIEEGGRPCEHGHGPALPLPLRRLPEDRPSPVEEVHIPDADRLDGRRRVEPGHLRQRWDNVSFRAEEVHENHRPLLGGARDDADPEAPAVERYGKPGALRVVQLHWLSKNFSAARM